MPNGVVVVVKFSFSQKILRFIGLVVVCDWNRTEELTIEAVGVI